MSAATSSPGSIENKSPNVSAFKSQAHSDPFLPNPSNSEAQLKLGPDGDTATTVNLSELENHHANGQLSGEGFNAPGSLPVSPNNLYLPDSSKSDATYTQPNTNPTSNVQSPTSHQDFLSPSDYAENGYSDFSSYGSPEIDDPFFLEPEFGLHAESEPLTLPVSEVLEHHIPQDNRPARLSNEHSLDTATFTASQLLSPGLTNTPSPPPSDPQKIDHPDMCSGRDRAHRPARMDIPAHRFQHTPTLTTTSPCSDSLEVNSFSHADRPTSPIVKVSSYTRGDSPSRNDGLMTRRADKGGRTTLSSSHLAPTDNKREYEYDEDDSHFVGSHYRSISVPASSLRADDGSWLADSSTGQRGLDPASRGAVYVPSPKEMMEQRKREQKNADVEQWLSVSEANSEVEDNGGSGRKSRRKNKLVTLRRRAKSTGDPSATDQQFFDDSKIPGPGVLIDEDSGVEDREDDDDSDASDSLPETPPANVNLDTRDEPSEGGYFPPAINDDENQNAEPLPRQFIRARPWQDPLRNPHIDDTRHQPSNSNAAIARFGRAADNIETASRAATWGTTRRMSESDARNFHSSNGSFNASYVDKEKKHTRRNSIFKHTNKLLPKRSNSSAKRKLAESSQQQLSTESADKTKNKESREGGLAGPVLPQRKPSFTRSPKSPLTTGTAVWAMTGQIAAVGGGGPVGVASPTSSSNPWNNFMRRSRSKSDLPRVSKSPGSGGLLELMTNFGGPPVPTLASPLQDKALAPSPMSVRGINDDDDDDDDDDEPMGDKGVTMDFAVRTDPIVPTLEGFKTQIQQLNPRLKSPALIERFAQEQVRRYKKLVDLKLQHVQAVRMKKCAAGKHCFEQGGEATMLPPRISSKDPDSTCAQFQVSGSADPDDDLSSFGEGTVTAALFPHGVPLPPVKRLPAQFECSLCFKVKSFQKPSDWTKHVHEDVMPFTCTFPSCTEPKSFKRKADWVRHESERHRQLEWWTCNLQDCSHTCYRKDNFVQHLVREHKMPEPKIKASRGRGSGNSKAASKKTDIQQSSAHDPGVDKVWKLVEECHHTTTKLPKDEACRFCDNVCNSWKKLSVHMAKHMEQIAMPVLGLVKQRTIYADTLISPIELGSYPPRPKSGNGQSPMSPLPGTTPYQNSFQSDQAVSAGVDPSTYYNSAAQNAETYATSASPLLADHLQMHAVQAELSAVSLGMGGRSISVGGQSYNLSPYPQSASPSVSEHNVYPVTTGANQQQFSPHPASASATYPPPYNAMSRRHELPIVDTTQTPVSGTMYNLNISVATSNTTAYENQQQHMYASPVDNARYVYHQNQDGMGPSEVLHYNDVPETVQYPVVSEPSGGATGQAQGYGQHRGGPYQYLNQ
ncbi:hypothetical protein AJ78_06647 [Emergomyces pasteurianus Ep9510]|uniref:C2H2-type domain-containing protein n=1 Tax=Emergomyces pasteurianus Ep9510 TaxID=1447872 RepID=A0A1J9P8M1_9EURO|nr:hypothetical protein AJ78_06647 [Emergomyces pasteurianus Ep9510]